MTGWTSRSSTQTWIVIGGVLGCIILLAVVLGTMTGRPRPERSTPQQVQQRVVSQLESNDLGSMYTEMAPSFRDDFPLDSFLEGTGTGARVLDVEVMSEPVIMTGDPWNAEWADGQIKLVYQDHSQTYLTRYHLEEGQWWLYATLELE